MNPTCRHWDDVSAAIDGELPPARAYAVLSHARRCPACGPMLDLWAWPGVRQDVPEERALVLPDGSPLRRGERRWLHDRLGRALLVLVALVIIGDGLSTYLQRVTTAGTAGHTLRHVATWQIAFGAGLLVAGWLARFSQALLALATTFAVLTLSASTWDVLTGHRGPIAEWVHLVELVAVGLLWRMTPPHLRPRGPVWARRRAPESGGPPARRLRVVRGPAARDPHRP